MIALFLVFTIFFRVQLQLYQDILIGAFRSLSMPMGVHCVEIGFDMEVQPLGTHNAA